MAVGKYWASLVHVYIVMKTACCVGIHNTISTTTSSHQTFEYFGNIFAALYRTYNGYDLPHIRLVVA